VSLKRTQQLRGDPATHQEGTSCEVGVSLGEYRRIFRYPGCRLFRQASIVLFCLPQIVSRVFFVQRDVEASFLCRDAFVNAFRLDSAGTKRRCKRLKTPRGPETSLQYCHLLYCLTAIHAPRCAGLGVASHFSSHSERHRTTFWVSTPVNERHKPGLVASTARGLSGQGRCHSIDMLTLAVCTLPSTSKLVCCATTSFVEPWHPS
jgi:hypothetical protein